MRFSSACGLAIALLFAAHSHAQPAQPGGNDECVAELQSLERDIEVAHSKGQMLRRRQLEAALAKARTRCGQEGPELTLRERIERQEGSVARLRDQLQRAEEELRRLRDEAQ